MMKHFDEIITTPRITKAGIAEFLSRSKDPGELYQNHIVLHTSGSSGEIGYFVYTPSDWTRGFVQYSLVLPFSFGRRRAAYFAATQGHFAGITQFLTMRRSFLKWLYRVRSFEINGPLQPVIEGLNEFQPDILAGYPSGLLMLARKQQTGELRISLSYCEHGGEPLSPEDRHIIESAFKVPILNFYASTEHMLMAIANPLLGGMYLCEDDLIFECQYDHTCVTNLFNRTQPLIRYRMEDILDPMQEQAYRFPYQRIRDLVGRMEQAPVFHNRHGNEDFISPIVIVEFQAKHLRRFQIVLVNTSSFEIKAVLEEGLSASERDAALLEIRTRLQEMLRQKEMDNVSFTIEEVDELQVDPRTGKFKLIVRSQA